MNSFVEYYIYSGLMIVVVIEFIFQVLLGHSDGPAFLSDFTFLGSCNITSLFYVFNILTIKYHGEFLFWSCLFGGSHDSCI